MKETGGFRILHNKNFYEFYPKKTKERVIAGAHGMGMKQVKCILG
jgi:hypothetical protein